MNEPLPTAFAEPVRILSDLHLAHPASRIDRVASLRPLIEGAGTVIFNGDSGELSFSGWRDEALERIEELRGLCISAGARPVFLAGNHDPEIAETGWLDLAMGRLFVTHGHLLCPAVAPWSPEFLRQKERIRDVIDEGERAADDLPARWETTKTVTQLLKPDRARRWANRGRKYLLSAFWPPERCLQILRVWLTMVRDADRFMSRHRPDARVLLFGHFHRAGHWNRNGRLLCNTGAFLRGSRPLMAELHHGTFSVRALAKDGDTFRPGATRTEMRLGDGPTA